MKMILRVIIRTLTSVFKVSLMKIEQLTQKFINVNIFQPTADACKCKKLRTMYTSITHQCFIQDFFFFDGGEEYSRGSPPDAKGYICIIRQLLSLFFFF